MEARTRRERVALFIEAMREEERASTEAEVLELMERCIDRVEDAHSGVDKDPDSHSKLAGDGRMYAPHPNFRVWNEALSLAVYRQRGHCTFVAANGAFAIFTVPLRPGAKPVFAKPGADGEAFWRRAGWRDPPKE